MLDLLEVVADPNRRKILRLLAKSEQSVTVLSESFDISRSAISQQLILLAEAGLVSARKEGRNRIYKIEPFGMVKLRQFFLDQFWSSEIDSLVQDAQSYLDVKKTSSKKTIIR
ncbi:MAG: metalloregulator ArsR/SmtB family transcription factor [Actinomycetes bacterium]